LHILAIYGSPRKDGFSSRLHIEFIIPFERRGFLVSRVFAYDLNIFPCQACNYCKENKSCFLKDDMTDIYRLIEEADIISISSPLYFSSVPSPLKAIIDRTQCLWEKYRSEGKYNNSHRYGFFICTGGSIYQDMFCGVQQMMRHFFNGINLSFDVSDFVFVNNTDSMEKIPEEKILQINYSAAKYIRLITED
jgi:multimeric flavodoxin WrbA